MICCDEVSPNQNQLSLQIQRHLREYFKVLNLGTCTLYCEDAKFPTKFAQNTPLLGLKTNA